jgi:hypothetical protein
MQAITVINGVRGIGTLRMELAGQQACAGDRTALVLGFRQRERF